MMYSRAFFDLQITFARTLATKFQLPLADALRNYTTLPKNLDIESDWGNYVERISHADHLTGWAYAHYAAAYDPTSAPKPDDTTYYGHPLFGCFYFVVRDTHIVCPHFVKNDLPGMRPLNYNRVEARRDELRRMFTHIKQHVPAATTVLGNSWMYNLPAYHRLYPPAYTAMMEESDEDEFQSSSLWGQCYNMEWQIKHEVAHELFHRLVMLDDLAQLRFCFPYQVLRPRCAIEQFYTFYGIHETPHPD